MEFKRILWPTDLSDKASQALPYVISLTEKYGAHVLVLHVQDEVSQFDRMARALGQENVRQLREKVLEQANTGVEQLCASMRGTCQNVERHVMVGDPVEEILKFVDKKDIDLVVMATHGYGGIKRFAYGSVAEKVVLNAPVPVLTVRCK